MIRGYVQIKKEDEQELFNYLFDFVRRVSKPYSENNTKTPEEVAILPAMTKLFVSLF